MISHGLVHISNFILDCYTGGLNGNPDWKFTTIAVKQNGGYNVVMLAL